MQELKLRIKGCKKKNRQGFKKKSRKGFRGKKRRGFIKKRFKEKSWRSNRNNRLLSSFALKKNKKDSENKKC